MSSQRRARVRLAGEGRRIPFALDEFVARLNVEHLQRKLTEETDDLKRQTMARLLKEEQAKLAMIEAAKSVDQKA